MRNLFCILTLGLAATSVSGQSFFIPTTFRGAFGTTDWTTGWTNWNPKNSSYPVATVTVQGDITTNTTWTADKVYLLKGYVYVKNNAVLTIEPGTIIRCDVINATCLVITRGAKINAQGTAGSPIVFTSNESIGARTYGDWGGILILGKGTVNTAGGTAEPGAGINNAKGDGLYGGTDDNDSSGIMHYVRIEFAGIQYQPDKEIPGLTLGACGTKTDLDFIQISYSGNEGLRLSGGNGRIRHLVIHRGYNSDITMDLGYRGLLQFGVILRDSTKANASGTSGIEVENDGLASGATPLTSATISNFTILGPMTRLTTPFANGYRYGLHIRRNGSIAVFNSAIAGYPRGVMLDGPGAANQMKSGNIIIQNSVLAGNKVKSLDTIGNVSGILPGFDILSWYSGSGFSNSVLSNPADLKLYDPYNYTAPVFITKTGSPLQTGASFTHARLNETELNTHIPEFFRYRIFQSGEELHIENLLGGNQGNPVLNIYDLSGRLLIHEKCASGNQTISTANLPAGILIAAIRDEKGNLLGTLKFLR